MRILEPIGLCQSLRVTYYIGLYCNIAHILGYSPPDIVRNSVSPFQMASKELPEVSSCSGCTTRMPCWQIVPESKKSVIMIKILKRTEHTSQDVWIYFVILKIGLIESGSQRKDAKQYSGKE